MKILIPMAGRGQRFIAAGYSIPKHLIEVEGLTIIEHIVNNFSKEDFFVFGCNEEQLRDTNMPKFFKTIPPNHIVVSMPYKKEGPVYGIKKMMHAVQDDESVVVNYCDFSWRWDYNNFKKKMIETNCDGAVVCYRGFHPHLLETNKYATVLAEGMWMKEIKEKHSWSKNKMDDWSSSGTYYFKHGSFLKEYIQKIEKRTELKINGELYISQLLQLMKEDGLNILVYEISFMLQWGTPEDLQEYLYWSDYFKVKDDYKITNHKTNLNILIPMAGKGKRFSDENFTTPKPLIQINNMPMVARAVKDLPAGNKSILIVQKEHLDKYKVDEIFKSQFSDAEIITIDYMTEGQAISALLAKDLINNDTPLLIGACDNGMLYDYKKFERLTTSQTNIDALIFTFRNNRTVLKNPQMYGWVKTDKNQKAINISVKKPISNNPVEDHAIIGTFWFKKGRYFIKHAEEMIKSNDTINNEYYIDNCMNYLIKDNLNVFVFEVDKYICWGTPNDLRIYEYWEKYFNLSNIDN